jgi:hypothetical protein
MTGNFGPMRIKKGGAAVTRRPPVKTINLVVRLGLVAHVDRRR